MPVMRRRLFSRGAVLILPTAGAASPFPLPQGKSDLSDHTVQVLHYIIVGKAQDAIALMHDRTRANRVTRGGVSMGIAVDFDHQFLAEAQNIGIERPEWRLVPPFQVRVGLAQRAK